MVWWIPQRKAKVVGKLIRIFCTLSFVIPGFHYYLDVTYTTTFIKPISECFLVYNHECILDPEISNGSAQWQAADDSKKILVLFEEVLNPCLTCSFVAARAILAAVFVDPSMAACLSLLVWKALSLPPPRYVCWGELGFEIGLGIRDFYFSLFACRGGFHFNFNRNENIPIV